MLWTTAACAHAPVAPPPATPQVINVAIPRSLEPLTSSLRICAGDQPGIALFVDDPPMASGSIADLSISLGNPPPSTGYPIPLAIEKLEVVLNRSNKIDAISTETLRNIFSGQISSWDKLGGQAGPIQVWDYPASDFLHNLFDQAVLRDSPVTSLANLAPSPSEMIASIEANRGAIGYLPAAWLSGEKVNAIKLDPESEPALLLPVVAISQYEPQGALRTFAACLQSGQGHAEIIKHYQAYTP